MTKALKGVGNPPTLPSNGEIVRPWADLSLNEKKAALREINRLGRQEGKAAAQRAMHRYGLPMNDEMIRLMHESGAVKTAD